MSIVGPLKLKVQLMCAHEPAMGPGKALVLESIDRMRSISAAGRGLGMSYRKTWLLVDSMNRCWDRPLVDTAAGSRGGATLTELGREVLTAFRALERRLEVAAEAEDYAMLVRHLRDAPLDPHPPSPA